MFQVQRAVGVVVLAIFASAAGAQPAGDKGGGVVIDVSGQKGGKYPIALPTAPENDAVAKEVAQVETFDLNVAGPFKVLEPQGFLADLKSEGTGIEPQKWKDVGAYGVIKYKVTGDAIDFKLYEVSKGNKPTLEKSYKRAGTDTRTIVHKWANEVVKYYTGEPGFFGSKITFTAKGKGKSAIMAMDFDGHGAYSVSNNSSTNILPAFSPSGGQIAYTSFMRSNPDLYIAPAGGGRPKQLSKQKGMNTGASFSPDGSKLAVTLSKDGNPEIYVISASDGSVISRLTKDRAIDTSPAWSPDGTKVAYTAFVMRSKTKTRNADLFIYEIPTGKRWLVSYRQGINSGANFDPDKKNIYLTISQGGSPDIFKMTTDGTLVKKLTNGPLGAMNVEPAISPDGKRMAFSSDRSGNPMIYVMNSDGTSPKRITFAGKFNATPAWSPDGKRIAFSGWQADHFDVFVMDADGTNMIRITSARKPSGKWSRNEDPVFSPDGRLLMYTSDRTGTSQIYISNLDGTEERRITNDNHNYFKPKWSPNQD